MPSPSVNATLLGVREWDAAVDRMVHRMEDASTVGLKEAETLVTKTIKRKIHNRTGRLAASIGSESFRDGPIAGMKIGPPTVPYAFKVEFGKRGAYHAPAYPYFRPGFTEAVPGANALLEKAWRGALEG